MTDRHEFITDLSVAPLLASLHKESFEKSWQEKDFEDLLKVPGGLVQIVVRDEIPMGFCFYRLIAGEAEILTVGVSPGSRNKAIGESLLREGFQRLQQLDVHKLFLEVSENNIPALRLYQKTGFIQSGRRKNYYTEKTDKVDALVMEKTL